MRFVPTFALSILVLASCASTRKEAAPTAAEAPRAPSALTLAHFEQLKGLEGDWYAADVDGNPEGDVVLSYRVSSADSAVIETTFPGADFEMTTVYTLDRDALVLTHYCAIGNAPRMRAAEGGEESSLHFECTGVGNAASHDDLHMHDVLFEFRDDGRLRSVWTLWGDGGPGKSEAFELVRG